MISPARFLIYLLAPVIWAFILGCWIASGRFPWWQCAPLGVVIAVDVFAVFAQFIAVREAAGQRHKEAA